MKFLVDENMSRKWVQELKVHGHQAVHWLEVGKKSAPDNEILLYAKSTKAVVLTCDLDFGDILAATGDKTPSVLQLRPRKMRPEILMPQVIEAITKYNWLFKSGVLLTIDSKKTRARALPLTD